MANINKCGSNNKANGKYHLKVLNNQKPNSDNLLIIYRLLNIIPI